MFYSTYSALYIKTIHYILRNHLLDKTLKTKLNGLDVKLCKQILKTALNTDASHTEFRKAFKIKPDHIECKVSKYCDTKL